MLVTTVIIVDPHLSTKWPVWWRKVQFCTGLSTKTPVWWRIQANYVAYITKKALKKFSAFFAPELGLEPRTL